VLLEEKVFGGTFAKGEDQYAGISCCAPIRTRGIMCKLPKEIPSFVSGNDVS